MRLDLLYSISNAIQEVLKQNGGNYTNIATVRKQAFAQYVKDTTLPFHVSFIVDTPCPLWTSCSMCGGMKGTTYWISSKVIYRTHSCPTRRNWSHFFTITDTAWGLSPTARLR